MSIQQEEVHVATIVNLLKAYNKVLIPPYNYSFLVNSIKQFFKLANIITLISIGATISLAKRLAFTNPLLVKSVALILVIKSRYNAFFQYIKGKVPNLAPFDTGISDI